MFIFHIVTLPPDTHQAVFETLTISMSDILNRLLLTFCRVPTFFTARFTHEI